MKTKDQIISEIGGWFLAATFVFITIKLLVMIF